MNKRTVIIIISVVAALAIVVGGTVAILASKFKNAPEKNNPGEVSSNITSVDGSTENKNESESSPASNDATSNSEDKTESEPVKTDKTDNSDETDTSTESVPKANKDMTTFIVGNTSAKVGGKVKVPVYVSSNKGFMGVFAKFKYDTSSLKYKGYKKGNILSDYEVQESNGEIKFLSVERGDVTKDGVALYLEFEVVAKKATTTPVSVSIGANDIANKSEQYVKVDTINGEVTIK